MRRLRHLPLRTGLAAALLTVTLAAAAAGAAGLSLNGASTNASWKEGWLRPGAKVSFSGSLAAPADLKAVLRPMGRAGVVTATLDYSAVPAGSFNLQLPLPARPLPGRYQLKVSGKSNGTDLTPATKTVVVPTPLEGVLARAEVAAKLSGPWLRFDTSSPVIHGQHTQLYARFRFLSPPATASKVDIVWRLSWHRLIGQVTRRVQNVIDTSVASAQPLPKGVWSVVLSVHGRVAKRMSVRIS